jgi:hypothetical protein
MSTRPSPPRSFASLARRSDVEAISVPSITAPEEFVRIVTDQLPTLFTPSEDGDTNLLREVTTKIFRVTTDDDTP